MDGYSPNDSINSLETTQEITDSSLNLSSSSYSADDADISADPDSISRELTDVASLLNRRDLELDSLTAESGTDDSVISSPSSVRLPAGKCAVDNDGMSCQQQQQQQNCNNDTGRKTISGDVAQPAITIPENKHNSSNSPLNGSKSPADTNGMCDGVFSTNGDSEPAPTAMNVASITPLRSSTQVSLDGYAADMSASVIMDADTSAMADTDASNADIKDSTRLSEMSQNADEMGNTRSNHSGNNTVGEFVHPTTDNLDEPTEPLSDKQQQPSSDKPPPVSSTRTSDDPDEIAADSGSALADSQVAATLSQVRENVATQRELELSTEDPRTNSEGWLDVVGNGQLKKKVLSAGIGNRDDRPKRGQVVTLRVVRRHLSSDVVTSDSASDHQSVLKFGVGDGEVITGLDMVVGLMQRGERAEIQMASKFGYGSKGLPDEGIPPDSDLVYIVELETIEPEPRAEELSCQQRLDIGNSKRECGNWWFKREDYSHAIQCYRRALDFLDSDSDDITGLPDDVHVLLEERLKVHNNMAAAQLKLHAYDAALRSIQLVLNCQPDNVKALFRKSKIYSEQKKWAEAEAQLRIAISAEPNNSSVRKELNRVSTLRKREADAERDLYRRMWGNTPDKRTVAKTRSGLVAGVMVGSVAVGLIAALLYRFKMF